MCASAYEQGGAPPERRESVAGRHPGPERHSRLREPPNPEANATSFVDGWFRPATRLSRCDGYLWLVARIKELINRAARRSRRARSTRCCSRIPRGEAVCFGVPHATWGEEVAAAVSCATPSRRPTADVLPRALGRLQASQTDHITQTIPRTATGKIQRGVVAKTYARRRRKSVRSREDRHRGAGAYRRYIGANWQKPAPTSCCSRAPSSEGDAGARPAA